jgi:putative peptidoglycan lipid II flippase
MKRFTTLASLAAVDIAIGFGVQVMVLLRVGVGEQTDAYYAGQAPMLVLFAIFQLPLQRAVVSAFAATGVETRYPALRLHAVVVLAMLLLAATLSLAGEFALHFVYPGLSAPATETALTVLRVQGAATAISAGNLVLLALNHVRGRFVQCEIALASSAVLSAIWVFVAVDRFGVVAAAHGQLIKALISGLVYLFLLRGKLTWQTPPWQHVWNVVKPLSTAGLFSKMTPLVDRSIASAAASGSLTMLVFAQTIYGASIGVAERAIVAPRLPELKRNPSLATSMLVALRLAIAGAMLAMVLILGAAVALQLDFVLHAVSEPVLKLLLDSLILLAGFPIGTLGAQWLAATLVFMDQAKLSARVMTWCFLVGVPVKIVGFQLGGIRGLAIAMSCYYLASAGSLWLVLRHLASKRT